MSPISIATCTSVSLLFAPIFRIWDIFLVLKHKRPQARHIVSLYISPFIIWFDCYTHTLFCLIIVLDILTFIFLIYISQAGEKICWPDTAVAAITALEKASHETLGSDFQKYNQKMRQLDFNLKVKYLLLARHSCYTHTLASSICLFLLHDTLHCCCILAVPLICSNHYIICYMPVGNCSV